MDDLNVLELLDERPNHVHPIVLGLDGLLGNAVASSVAGSSLTSIERHVYQEIRLGNFDGVLESTHSPQRIQAIMPTKLVKPAWAIAAFNFTPSSTEHCAKFLDACSGMNRLAGIYVDVDLESDDAIACFEYAKSLSESGVLVWLLSPAGNECNHQLADLATAFTEYMLAAWRRHRDPKGPNLRESLNIYGSSQIFTLGVGRLAPDVEFHAQTIAPTIARSVWSRLSQDSSPNPIPEPPIHEDEILNTVAGLLPHSAFAHGPRQSHGSMSINTLSSRIGIDALSKPRFGIRTLEQRRLKAYLAWLQELDGFFEQIEAPAIGVAIRKGSNSFGERICNDFQSALMLPTSATGIVWFYKQLFLRWEEFFTHLKSLENTSIEPTSLSGDIRRIQNEVSELPALGGIVLRSALVALTFFWIFIGAHIWSGQPWPWQDPLLGWTALLAAVGIIAIPGIGVLGYYKALNNCLRVVQRARLGVFRRHVNRALECLVEATVDVGNQSMSLLDFQQAGFNRMVDSLTSSPDHQSNEDITNNAPAFPKGSLDSVISEHLPAAIDRSMDRFPEAISGSIQEQDDPLGQWSADLWQKAISALAHEEARSAVLSIPFAEAADASNASPENCVALALDSTRHPAFPRMRSTPPPSAFLFAPSSWQWESKTKRAKLLGSYDKTVVIASDSRRDLIAVASIPVPVTWNSSQRGGA